MRLRLAALLLALLGAGCRDSATEPSAYRPVTDAVPTGLPVVLRTIPSYDSPLPSTATVVAAGDSIVATAALSVSGCVDYAAQAGRSGAAVVVTIVSSFPATPRFCTMNLASATFRAVVRPAPRGSYDVVLRDRVQMQAGTPLFDERELARRTVTVR